MRMCAHAETFKHMILPNDLVFAINTLSHSHHFLPAGLVLVTNGGET